MAIQCIDSTDSLGIIGAWQDDSPGTWQKPAIVLWTSGSWKSLTNDQETLGSRHSVSKLMAFALHLHCVHIIVGIWFMMVRIGGLPAVCNLMVYVSICIHPLVNPDESLMKWYEKGCIVSSCHRVSCSNSTEPYSEISIWVYGFNRLHIGEFWS